MRIIHLPIEPLQERYSLQWREWFSEYWPPSSQSAFVDVEPLTSTIEIGSFLDVYGTCYYKAKQMTALVHFMKAVGFGEREGDWVLFHDLWSPEVLSVAYMRDGAGLKFGIAGCLHAGTWDTNDFLVRKGMDFWARGFESSIPKITDLIFFATHYHKDLFLKHHKGAKTACRVTGFPIYPDCFVKWKRRVENERLVVFPHRKDPEKCPELFIRLKEELADIPNTSFVFTKDACSTKEDYYRFLGYADIAVSFAKQETWGIAMQEALFCGCVPFVPDRLSYREMYAKKLRYRSFEDLKEKIRLYLMDDWEKEKCIEQAEASRRVLKKQGEQAIQNMEKEIRRYGC